MQNQCDIQNQQKILVRTMVLDHKSLFFNTHFLVMQVSVCSKKKRVVISLALLKGGELIQH